MPVNLLKTPSATLKPAQLPAGEIAGLYVHVPFCAHKCHYCDFYSITRQPTERMERFVSLMLREADQWTHRNSLQIRPATVFFGGGTPTLLPPHLMARLIGGLQGRFDWSAVNEFTVEANPATVDKAYCDLLLESGVNRISFGAQSFDRNELHVLERHHNPEDVPQGIDYARQAGFQRINLDLIYAIPGQSLKSFTSSLDTALSFGLQHLSCYGLTYEPNTAMTVRKRLGQFTAAPESLELEMFHSARTRLSAAGLRPYEISNFAIPGQACRHNLMYWRGGSYIGLGPSAASHVHGWRFKNRPHLGEWEQAIESDQLPAMEIETLTPRQRAGELVMLGLRLPEGIRYSDIERITRLDGRSIFAQPVDRLTSLGLLDGNAEGFRLTETALHVADAVAGEFLE